MASGFQNALKKRIKLLAAMAALLFPGCGGFFVDPQVVQITVTPATPSILTGYGQQFTAVAQYDDGTRKVISKCTWSTSNASVLLVDSKGWAWAVTAGSATVAASADVASGSTSVTVTDSPITSITISPLNPSISKSKQATQQFSATATYGDGSSRDVTSSVTWSSSDRTVATISSTGLASAVIAGTTTIQAATGNESASTQLTILP